MTERNPTKKRRRLTALLIIAAVITAAVLFAAAYFLRNSRYYSAEDFGIEQLKSEVDFNSNGVDDYTEMVLGARTYMERKPPYKSLYYVGGYPTDEYAVCTDVVWAAMQSAGYCLKDAVDKDISENKQLYFTEDEKRDPNIDFRRVRNLKIYFERHAESLTTDTRQIEQWQPGDIVVYSPSHIAVVSDRRNADGVPYILHQSTVCAGEADLLGAWKIEGHYRITGDYEYVV